MTASVRRRATLGAVLGAVALLALVAFGALFVGAGSSDRGRATRVDPGHAHVPVSAGAGDAHGRESSSLHALSQPPWTRGRGIAFAVLATAVVAVAWPSHRMRLARAVRPRSARDAGLPPGRAPPTLRIA
jgi:hypothetical protein